MNIGLPKAFGVNFESLHRWSVRSFFSINWQWPKQHIRPLSDALERRTEQVDRNLYELEDLNLLTIRFDGSMEPRNMHGKRKFKGQLFFAYPNDVVYSKIDVRNGAIGVVPDNLAQVAVTSEFPVYRIRECALPQYIKLVFRTSHFQYAINSNISGTSGRKRVQPRVLEELTIPLPPLEVQRAIVRQWEAAQQKIRDAEERLTAYEHRWANVVREKLGMKSTLSPVPRVYGLQWKHFHRWGVEINWDSMANPHTSAFPLKKLKDICEISSGGTPSRRNPRYFSGMIPWVKTTDVRDSEIVETEEGITELGLQNSSARLYPKGSLIIAMYGQGATRGRTAKLGIEAATNQACAVLTNIDKHFTVDFVWYYLMSEYSRLRKLASGNNQPNLSTTLLGDYPIPAAPFDVQQEIVEHVQNVFSDKEKIKVLIELTREKVLGEVEEMILGTRPWNAQ